MKRFVVCLLVTLFASENVRTSNNDIHFNETTLDRLILEIAKLDEEYELDIATLLSKGMAT